MPFGLSGSSVPRKGLMGRGRACVSECLVSVVPKGQLEIPIRLLEDPARFWKTSGPEVRPLIQTAIYPNGFRFSIELIGTAETSIAFSYLADIEAKSDSMARPEGL